MYGGEAGNVTFTSLAEFTGVSIITYTVRDDQGALSNPATIRVVVAIPENQPPVARDDQGTTLQDTPVTLSVIANDSDPDGAIDPASVDLDPNTPARQTTVTAPGQGAFTADDTGNVTFTPQVGFTGTSMITYTIQDDRGAPSNSATIAITVTEVVDDNQPPVAVSDTATTSRDTPVTLNVIANDSDPDGAIDPASVDLSPDTPGRQTTATVPGQGAFIADNAGNVRFTPEAGFTGGVTISYLVRDDQGAPSNTATIIVVVEPSGGFAPPAGLKFVNPSNLPEVEWRLVWLNNGNLTANTVRVTDDIPDGTLLVPDSLQCEARGRSTIDRCAFEAEANRIVYEGTIAADFGVSTEEEAIHEVVLTYRAIVVPLGFFGLVENQAQANWDADGDGTPENDLAALQPPALSDDPTSPPPFDPTVLNISPRPRGLASSKYARHETLKRSRKSMPRPSRTRMKAPLSNAQSDR